MTKTRSAEWPPRTLRAVSDLERPGGRDYARFDFRADATGAVKLLEVNPNLGWRWDGKLNLMTRFARHRHADLLRLIIDAARQHIAVSRDGGGTGAAFSARTR